MRSLGAEKSFKNYDIIVESLSSRNGNQARLEMISYYTIIIDAILSDMENLAIDQARARINMQRERYL